jgi:hypothetical protein
MSTFEHHINNYITNDGDSVNNPFVLDQAQAYLKCEALAPYLVQAEFKRDPLASDFPQQRFPYISDPSLHTQLPAPTFSYPAIVCYHVMISKSINITCATTHAIDYYAVDTHIRTINIYIYIYICIYIYIY